ncbi:MAG: sigma-70 family RNA polymerase sigma factor [Thermoanaerobaculia bacterium]
MTRQPGDQLQLTDLLLSSSTAAKELERRCRMLLRSKFGGNPMAREQTDDLVQEVLMACFKQAQKLAAGDSPPILNVDAWLCRVTMNAVWRTWHREGEGLTGSLDEVMEPNLPASEALDLAERLAVRQALKRLDAACRRLLWQRDVLGEARQGVAEALGITSNALGVRIHRCRKRLHELYEKQLAEAL